MPAPQRRSSSSFLSALLSSLLLLGELSALIMDKPDVNGTTRGIGISQQREPASAATSDAKQLKNPIDYSSRFKNKTGTQIIWSSRAGNAGIANITIMSGKRNLTASSKITSSDLRKAVQSRRSSAQQQKYIGYGISKEHSNNNHQKEKTYGASEDYEQPAQHYGQEYYPSASYDYEEKYNTITEEQNGNNYEGVLTDPWRVAYVPPDLGYYAPPPASAEVYYGSAQGAVPLSDGQGCYCPRTSTRQNDCESPSNSFLNIISALGRNLWALAQLMATTSLPFIIPLVAIKMIIVPLKILKILKLIKIFLKLFVILPLFMRVVSPALSQINLPNIFQSLQDMFPSMNTNVHPLHRPHPRPPKDNEFELEGREEAGNGSSSSAADSLASSALGRDDYFGNETLWDLRACPSRVACEMGVYVAAAMYDSFPQNLVDYFARRASRAEARSEKEEEKGDKEEEEEEDETDDDSMQNMAFKAFLIALGKRWTQEQCDIYRCWVLS